MRAVVQRVSRAEVRVGDQVMGCIESGLLTLLAVAKGDHEKKAERLIAKITKLRIFPDESGKMNLSLAETQGSHLIVSQFTLLADCSKGNRPSFGTAAEPELARSIYDHAVRYSASLGIPTQSGQFQADMQVDLVNDGPVTLILEVKDEEE